MMILIHTTCESAQKYVKDFPPFKFFSNHLKSTAGAIKQSTKCYNVTPEGNTRFTPIKPENAVHIDEISSNASGAPFIGITLIFFYYVGTSFLSSAILKPFNLSRTWLSRINNLIEWQCKGATIWLFMQVCEAWAKEDKENAELKLLKTRPGPSSDNTPITPETSVPDDLSTFARYNWLCPSFLKTSLRLL